MSNFLIINMFNIVVKADYPEVFQFINMRMMMWRWKTFLIIYFNMARFEYFKTFFFGSCIFFIFFKEWKLQIQNQASDSTLLEIGLKIQLSSPAKPCPTISYGHCFSTLRAPMCLENHNLENLFLTISLTMCLCTNTVRIKPHHSWNNKNRREKSQFPIHWYEL